MKQDPLDTPFHESESDFNHPFGNYFPLPFVGFGLVLIGGGLYTMIFQSPSGILLIPFGFIMVFAKKGITVSFSLGKYRDYFGLFSYKSGNWKSLPECEYISVFAAVESQKISANAQTTSLSNRVVFVNLIYAGNQRLCVYKTNNIDEAFKVAHLFSEKLNLDIFDATNRDKDWIKRSAKTES